MNTRRLHPSGRNAGAARGMAVASLFFLTGSLVAATMEIEAPGMEAVVFAEAPLIERPVAVAVDAGGRLLLVERLPAVPGAGAQTKGEERIVIVVDEDADGKGDRREVFHADLREVKGLAADSDGWVYVLTRGELYRIRDSDGDGKAETEERRLVVLEQETDNDTTSLSGLALADSGFLCFGLSGGRGAECKLKGADGWVEDCGLDGSVWRVRVDGGGLRRMAGGLAQVGGVGVGKAGQVFAADQDSAQRLPARLLQVIPEAEFGFRESYSAVSGHPFFCWQGERLGTLPPLCATGDAPGGMLVYAPQSQESGVWFGLPPDWHGRCLIASAGDHRVEAVRLAQRSGSSLWLAENQALVQGGREFRPVALAARPDGTLWVADEGMMESRGKVWLIRRVKPAEWKAASKPAVALDLTKELRETITEGPAPSIDKMIDWLGQEDPVVFHLAVRRLSRDGLLTRELASGPFQFNPRVRAGVLLAARLGSEREGVPVTQLAREVDGCLLSALVDVSPEVAIPALQWVVEARMRRFYSLLDTVLRDESNSAEVLAASIIATEQIKDRDVTTADPSRLDNLLETRLRDRALKPGVRIKLLQARMAVSPTEPDIEDVRLIFVSAQPKDKEAEPAELIKLEHHRVWLAHFIGLMESPEKTALLREIVTNAGEAAAVRAAALSHYSAADDESDQWIQLAAESSGGLRAAALTALNGLRLSFAQQQTLQAMLNEPFGMSAQRVLGRPHHPPSRPQSNDAAAWSRYLRGVAGEPDAGHGRDVFFSASRGGCVACHQAENLGNRRGLDLGLSAASGANALLASLLRPSVALSSRAAMLKVRTTDARERLLCLIEKGAHASRYLDAKGHVIEIRSAEIERRAPASASIMPEGLLKGLTDEEIRDLLAYLTRSAGE